MGSYFLERGSTSVDLAEQEGSGTGTQATSITGLGLVSVDAQFEARGQGARFRRTRVLPRDVDIAFDIDCTDNAALLERIADLAYVLAGECTLKFVADDDSVWRMTLVRVGGGSIGLGGGQIVGGTAMTFSVTLRAGDPYWYADDETVLTFGPGVFTDMDTLSPVVVVGNPGDTEVYPLWEIHGSGSAFYIGLGIGSSYPKIDWLGAMGTTSRLYVDTRVGTVVDGAGANRYGDLRAGTLPGFFPLPPGNTNVYAGLTDGDSHSYVKCTFKARREVVV